MTKAFASIFAVLLIGPFGSPVTCGGWEQSAADRHACCLRAHHVHANDQAAADDCCARHEQGRRSEHAMRPFLNDPAGMVVGTSSWLDGSRDLATPAATLHHLAPHLSSSDLSPPPLRI
ncbi:MAG TPA: hypothetical protein VFZ98_07290 [Vicinamibacterales bacterium]